MPLHLGCHLSPTNGYLAMGNDALSIGADTFQFFTRNPRGSRARTIDPEDAAALGALQQAHAFAPTVAHAPYTLNPCSADARVREFAHMTMEDDLRRLLQLPCQLYNFHPGSHTGQGVEAGIRLTAALLSEMLSAVPNGATLLIETMAGQGSEIGSTFEQVAALIDAAGGGARPCAGPHPSRLFSPRADLSGAGARLGVCLDTCHVFAAGYDLSGDLDGVLAAFDRTIGLARLRAVHLNDSLHPLGSHRDRHARIGEGQLGLAALQRVTRHPALAHLPFLLETPQESLAGYAREIALLQETP